jgi:serine/threonine protein kinase
VGERVTVEKLSDGRLVALKVARAASDTARLVHEAAVLERARHPGVVELVTLEQPEDGPARLVTLVAGDQPLSSASRPPPARAAALLAAVASTLADLHSMGVVHGRVDPSHLVLAPDGRPVLCGFSGATLDPGDGDPQPHDDVAGVGRLARHLLDPDTEPEPIPERRGGWRLHRRPRWTGYQQRALLTLADQATAHDPRHRPSARAFAAAVTEAFPGASLSPPEPRLPAGATVAPLNRPAAPPRRPVPPSRRRRWRPAGAALAAAATGIVGLSSLAAGVGVLRTGERPEVRAAADETPPASTAPPSPSTSPPQPTSSTTSTTSPDEPQGGGTGSGCPAAAGPVADLDGDGCAGPLRVEQGVVDTDGGRFAVGEPDDDVVLGDWDCDGSSTPAVLRTGTGDVFVFERWASTARDETVEATTRVPDSTGARVDTRDGCDHLVVETRRGDQPVDTGGVP